jgi:hypothetical protein
MVPILCGSFQPFVHNGGHPARDEVIGWFHEVLRRECGGRKVLAVASVDFAHVGPVFGDSFPMDASCRQALRASDQSLIEATLQGDRARFYREIEAVGDRNRICGFSPIYHLLQFLGETEGQLVAYQHCPADENDTSLVSIAGMLLE